MAQVKKFESGMVVNPLTLAPDATLKEALELGDKHGFSGFPVVEKASRSRGSPASLWAFSPIVMCVLQQMRASPFPS